MSYEYFLTLAKEIDLLEDNINDALEVDDFGNAGKYSVQKQQKVKEITDLFKKLAEEENSPYLPALREYMMDLMQNEKEQLELLKAEQERVRQELIGLTKGNKGGSAYRVVRGYALPNHKVDSRLTKGFK